MKNLTIKDQILNTTSIEELKAIDLTNATSLEKAIVEFIISNDVLEEVDEIGEYEIAICRFDANSEFELADFGINCTIEDALEIENFWEEKWDEANALKENFKDKALQEEFYQNEGVNEDSEVLVMDYEALEKDFDFKTDDTAYNDVLSILEAINENGQKFVGEYHYNYNDMNNLCLHGRNIVILIEVFDEE